jgi:hypothetical protein
MGATNRFSEAAWELQMALLKPPEECTQISRRLWKRIGSSHAALEQLLHATVGVFRKICAKSKAFCNR